MMKSNWPSIDKTGELLYFKNDDTIAAYEAAKQELVAQSQPSQATASEEQIDKTAEFISLIDGERGYSEYSEEEQRIINFLMVGELEAAFAAIEEYYGIGFEDAAMILEAHGFRI